MAFDENLARRIRRLLAGRSDIREQRMFGGLTFMFIGNMCCGVAKDELVARVGLERSKQGLKGRHARTCDITGRPMKGLITVSPEGCKTDEAVAKCVDMAVGFAASLPPK